MAARWDRIVNGIWHYTTQIMGPTTTPSWQARLVAQTYPRVIAVVLGHPQTPHELRRKLRLFDACAPPVSCRSRIERIGVNGVVVETLPGRGTRRRLLYLPGGAFIVRTPRWHRSLFARLCRELNAGGWIVYYRLAPEHPYPAAVEDCVGAYEQLLASGVAAADVVLGGDSAGGGLTLATLMAARDRGLPLPGCAFMLSPLTDVSGAEGGSRVDNVASDPLIALLGAVGYGAAYLGGGAGAVHDPLVSPVYGDFAGLPPLLIQASRSEILRDDGVRAARAARAAGVACELELYPGLPHVWQLLSWLPEARASLASITRFVGTSTPTAAS
jgi:monoterpene epsilon-lactone hydrolase